MAVLPAWWAIHRVNQQERNLLSEDVLQLNLAGIQKQLEKFLDFNSGANSAEMVNNYDWFKEFSFLNFIRDVGKHITVNYMMAKDSVKNRIGMAIPVCHSPSLLTNWYRATIFTICGRIKTVCYKWVAAISGVILLLVQN